MDTLCMWRMGGHAGGGINCALDHVAVGGMAGEDDTSGRSLNGSGVDSLSAALRAAASAHLRHFSAEHSSESSHTRHCCGDHALQVLQGDSLVQNMPIL